MADRWVIPTFPAHVQRDDELTPDEVLDVLDPIGTTAPTTDAGLPAGQEPS